MFRLIFTPLGSLLKRFIIKTIGIISLFTISGCYNISNLQNASLLPPKEFDVSASYSANSYYDTKYQEHNFLASRLGIQSTYGLYKNLNLRAKYELVMPEYENVENIHYASIGRKLPI